MANLPEILPGAESAAAAATANDKLDSARKAARAKTLAAMIPLAATTDAQQKPARERKGTEAGSPVMRQRRR